MNSTCAYFCPYCKHPTPRERRVGYTAPKRCDACGAALLRGFMFGSVFVSAPRCVELALRER